MVQWRRALASHQVWVEFVVGSHVCSECLSTGSLVFLPTQKQTSPNSNLARIEDPHENKLG